MFDAQHIVQAGGLLAIAFIVFAESGLFFGFIFPGDSLLLTAGFFAAQDPDKLPIIPLIAVIVVAAILGDNVGYQTGKRLGPRIFKRPDGLLFRRDHVERAMKFYQKHGGKTIILARFFPAIRTFAPIVAGVGKMSWFHFASYNVIGGALWGIGVTMAGYLIGNAAPNVDNYMLWGIIIAGHIIMFIVLFHILGNRETRKKLRQAIGEDFRYFFKKNKNN